MGATSSDKPRALEVGEPLSAVADLNSKSALTDRVRTRQLTRTGPLLLVMGRSAFMFLAQGLTACILGLRSHSWSWNAAAKWWTVYGTLVDLGCLTLMAMFTRKEGIRLRDLIGPVRLRWGRDLFLGVGCLALILPAFSIAFSAASRLVYGGTQPNLYPGLLAARILPQWAVAYSFSLFLIFWSPTEEMTYNGYSLPRLEALFGNRWTAVGVVAFWWALQHSFIPFILDWKYVIFRFVGFVPGVLVGVLLYLRIRRLPPLILAHWSMDTLAVFYTLKL